MLFVNDSPGTDEYGYRSTAASWKRFYGWCYICLPSVRFSLQLVCTVYSVLIHNPTSFKNAKLL